MISSRNLHNKILWNQTDRRSRATSLVVEVESYRPFRILGNRRAAGEPRVEGKREVLEFETQASKTRNIVRRPPGAARLNESDCEADSSNGAPPHLDGFPILGTHSKRDLLNRTAFHGHPTVWRVVRVGFAVSGSATGSRRSCVVWVLVGTSALKGGQKEAGCQVKALYHRRSETLGGPTN